MDITAWILWGTLLISQNASFVLVSRARNSNNLVYHAWSSLLSNAIWFMSNFILFGSFIEIMKNSDWVLAAEVGFFYTACTMSGSLGMHWIALRKLEPGIRHLRSV